MRKIGFVDYLVRHRTAANLLMLLMIVGGLAAATQIRTQFFPDVVVEQIQVSVEWSGAAPGDIDDGLIAVLQPELRGVEGVRSSSSVAREGKGTITLEFEPGWDMARAADEVKAAIDATTTLPEDADEPEVTRRSYRDRVTDILVAGPIAMGQLVGIADELRARLLDAGIAKTRIEGLPTEVMRVSLRDERLEQYGLSLRDVADRITAEGQTSPAGAVEDGTAIRAGENRRQVDDVAAVALDRETGVEGLTVGDIATIGFDGNDRGEAHFVNGAPALIVSVERGAGGDALQMQARIESVLAQMRPTLPAGTTLELTGTRVDALAERLNILWTNAAYGLALVLILLFAFLSARTAFWVAAGIPTALAATVGLMLVAGITINMVSLFALIITLGIIVDDAIVVGEHADHLVKQGMPPADAASIAAARMAGPVVAASLTTVIAFAALTLIGGRYGAFIIDIPLTVIIVVLASLVECFLILPAHLNHALQAKARRSWIDALSRRVDLALDGFRQRLFKPLLGVLLRLRYPAVGGAICLLLISLSLVVAGSVSWRFFDAPERGSINANIAMLPGAERDDTMAMIAELERALAVVNDRYRETYGTAPVDVAVAKIGDSVGRRLASADDRDEDLLGGLRVELIDSDSRPYSAFQFIADWEAEIRTLPLLETLALRGERSGPGGDAIEVELSGGDLDTLKQASLAVQAALSRFPSVSALEDSLAFGKPELRLELTPLGEDLGFTTSMVARELRDRLAGVTALEFARGPRSAEILVETAEETLDAAYLDTARLKTPAGGFVPLHEIASFREVPGYVTIPRENGLSTVTVTGDIAGDDAAMVSEALAGEILPAIAAQFGIDYRLAGLAEDEGEFLSDAMLGGLLALLAIYLTLAWIFASWSQPLLIILVVPFSLVGMIWGHYWMGVSMSMFSVVGMIGMMGIIVNDSIVLTTAVNEATPRRAVMPAIIDATAGRLRAVLLTTLTTVCGLAPLLFETSRQAQFLKPTVITLVFGLGFGMVLVLVVTPALLAIEHDVRRSFRALSRLSQARRRRGLQSASQPI